MEKTLTYWSLDELANGARKGKANVPNRVTEDSRRRNDFCGGATFGQAIELARTGWNEQLDSALELAESAVETAVQEHMVDTFTPQWDVSGAEVDVARYLSGEPECMIDFPLSKTSKEGRVITLCACIVVSAAISAETIQRRGRLIVALALALSRLGHNVELWADNSTREGKDIMRIRTLVKGADDELDPARVMFAYAHAAMLRRLLLAASGNVRGMGYMGDMEPIPAKRDLSEGTIYLPEICSDHDIPNADVFLREHLGNLGLLAE